MGFILLLIIFVIALVIFYKSKRGKAKAAERKKQIEINHAESEKVIGPERKLHEEEKKRWEDEYWKHQ